MTPPFAKNETFGKRRATDKDPLRPPLTDAEREIELRLLSSWGINTQREADAAGIVWPETRYRDIWSWEADIHEDWLLELTESYEAIAGIINVARYTHGDGIAAYLCYMSIRLLEIHRVLKPTGSLYLHCDNNVNTCLGELLTAIFGVDNFRSAIAWKRTSTHSDAKNYANVLDTIFYYTKSDEYVWNPQHGEHDREYVADKYRYDDGDGRGPYTLDNMTSPNPRPNMMYEWQGHESPPKGWRYSRETMAQLDSEGRIWYPASKSQRPRLKRYLSEMPGRIVDSNWSDIPPLNSQARERTGYPTQKPVALAERIIAASTNPGDVVLDCFAGCAYVGVAAESVWAGSGSPATSTPAPGRCSSGSSTSPTWPCCAATRKPPASRCWAANPWPPFTARRSCRNVSLRPTNTRSRRSTCPSSSSKCRPA